MCTIHSRRAPFGHQRIQGAISRLQVRIDNTLYVIWLNSFHALEITIREIEVIHRDPAITQILRLPFHGLASTQRAGDELLHHFIQLHRSHRLVRQFIQFLQQCGTGRVKFIGIHHGAHAKQSAV